MSWLDEVEGRSPDALCPGHVPAPGERRSCSRRVRAGFRFADRRLSFAGRPRGRRKPSQRHVTEAVCLRGTLALHVWRGARGRPTRWLL